MSNWPEPDAEAWCVELSLTDIADDDLALGVFEAALEDPAGSGAVSRIRNEAIGGWTLRSVRTARPEDGSLRSRLAVAAAATGRQASSVSVEPLPATDWVAEVNRRTPPVRAGKFFVRGSHVTIEPPPGSIEIVLDAGRAFGTGSHESTRGCLLAFERMPAPGEGTVLDLGTGSGILAIAAAKLWRRPVLAADTDAVSVETANENAIRNGVGAMMEACRSRGFSNARLRRGAPYSLIAANILADPLIRLAPRFAQYLGPEGRAVLSGLLVEQGDAVAPAYASHGLAVRDRIEVGNWATLVVGRE